MHVLYLSCWLRKCIQPNRRKKSMSFEDSRDVLILFLLDIFFFFLVALICFRFVSRLEFCSFVFKPCFVLVWLFIFLKFMVCPVYVVHSPSRWIHPPSAFLFCAFPPPPVVFPFPRLPPPSRPARFPLSYTSLHPFPPPKKKKKNRARKNRGVNVEQQTGSRVRLKLWVEDSVTR